MPVNASYNNWIEIKIPLEQLHNNVNNWIEIEIFL